MKNFGFTGYDHTDYIGVNGKMNEVSAAMGLTNLESLEDFITVNRQNHEAYRAGLSNVPGLEIAAYDHADRNTYHYVVVTVDPGVVGLTRNQLVEVLLAENVLARKYFYPGCHRLEPYRSLFPHAGLLVPNTEWLSERILTLPTGTAVSEDDIRQVCQILAIAVENASEVKKSVLDVKGPRQRRPISKSK